MLPSKFCMGGIVISNFDCINPDELRDADKVVLPVSSISIKSWEKKSREFIDIYINGIKMTVAEDVKKDELNDILFNPFSKTGKVRVDIYINHDMKYPGKTYQYTLRFEGYSWAILEPIEN